MKRGQRLGYEHCRKTWEGSSRSSQARVNPQEGPLPKKRTIRGEKEDSGVFISENCRHQNDYTSSFRSEKDTTRSLKKEGSGCRDKVSMKV